MNTHPDLGLLVILLIAVIIGVLVYSFKPWDLRERAAVPHS